MDKRIKNKEIIPLEEVLSKFKKNTMDLIEVLDDEDRVKPTDTYDHVLNEKKALIESNTLKKKDFINELKSGLGDKVKDNGNAIRKVVRPKLTRLQRFSNFIRRIFTKF